MVFVDCDGTHQLPAVEFKAGQPSPLRREILRARRDCLSRSLTNDFKCFAVNYSSAKATGIETRPLSTEVRLDCAATLVARPHSVIIRMIAARARTAAFACNAVAEDFRHIR